MQFRHAIEKVRGLTYIFNCLEPQSSLGRRFLLDMEYMHQPHDIEHALQEIEQVQLCCFTPANEDTFVLLKLKLSQLRDIKGTIGKLNSSLILDDIELFEIKHFALLETEIASLLQLLNFTTTPLPNLSAVINILDPNHDRMASFYIYDSYSEELATLRKQLKAEKAALEHLKDNENIGHYKEKEKQIEDILLKSEFLEDNIRTNITTNLGKYKKSLAQALENAARLDALIAKTALAVQLSFCKPQIGNEKTVYKNIFHPSLKNLLEKEGKRYQSIDISFGDAPSLITGANMAGKTILLKTVLLVQYLFQFGFYIPAETATIVSVEEIMFCLEDSQSENKGLSSFAAEMVAVNEILKTAASGKKMLVLIDELARTTNPTEGKAIVSAMLDLLTKYKVYSLITTHYSNITTPCRKLRVKGFVQKNNTDIITPSNINEYIDYSLTEESEEKVPMEALHIASILGVSDELLSRAKEYLA